MPIRPNDIGWFSPDPRGVLLPSDFHTSRSLKRAAKKFHVTVDQAFNRVVDGCANPARPHGWITSEIKQAYSRLYRLGWAHSIEVWDDEGLAGGMYGLGVGAFFAGESMFHLRRDASKIALRFLAEGLAPAHAALIDVQWLTPHLASLGARNIRRGQYVPLLHQAWARPDAFDLLE